MTDRSDSPRDPSRRTLLAAGAAGLATGATLAAGPAAAQTSAMRVLEGQTVFVTGAARGIGQAIAAAMAEAGANVAMVCGAVAASSDVKVNAMCPGWVRTRMGGSAASRSPEERADTAFWLATLPSDGPTGGFFRDREPIPR